LRDAKTPMPALLSSEEPMNTSLMRLNGNSLFIQLTSWFHLCCQAYPWVRKGRCWWRCCLNCKQHPSRIVQHWFRYQGTDGNRWIQWSLEHHP
jgi:hypothetical protein